MVPWLKNKDLVGMPWLVVDALCEAHWEPQAEIIWYKPNAAPERVRDRQSRATERIYLFSKTERYFYRQKALRKYGESEQDDVWTIATRRFKGTHFATFPPELPERCILASTRTDDLVLDPFAGSGTTLAVARALRRRFIGIELNEEYRPLVEEQVGCARVRARRAGE